MRVHAVVGCLLIATLAGVGCSADGEASVAEAGQEAHDEPPGEVLETGDAASGLIDDQDLQEGEWVTPNTEELEALPEPEGQPVPTRQGSATVTSDTGESHTFQVTCWDYPGSVYLARGIDLDVRDTGDSTRSWLPDDYDVPWMYLVQSTASPGQVITAQNPDRDRAADDFPAGIHFSSQASWDDEWADFGAVGVWTSRTVAVAADGLSGEITEDHGRGYVMSIKWRCSDPPQQP